MTPTSLPRPMKRFHLLLALALPLGITACGKKAEADHDHDHGHAHQPQFGGTLVELGDHFANVEFVYLAEEGELSVYTLGAHAEATVPSPTEEVSATITAGDDEFTVTLLPQVSASTGDKVGSSSHFMVKDDRLKDLEHFDVELGTISVRGEDFTPHAHLGSAHHGDHDHDHDHDHGEDHDAEGHDDGDGDHGSENG